MIEWLREKFEAWIKILVILDVVISGIAGGVICAMLGYSWFNEPFAGFVGFLLGVAIGVVASLIFCIIFYGLGATFISIANSAEANKELLENTNSLLAEIKSCADTIKNKLNALDDISSKLNSVGATEK